MNKLKTFIITQPIAFIVMLILALAVGIFITSMVYLATDYSATSHYVPRDTTIHAVYHANTPHPGVIVAKLEDYEGDTYMLFIRNKDSDDRVDVSPELWYKVNLYDTLAN